MSTIIDVAADLLQAAGFTAGATSSTESSTALYWGRMPATPDLVLAVFEGPGVGPHLTMGSATAVERPRIQLLVRGAKDDYPAARRVLKRARAALTVPGGHTVAGFAALAFVPDDAVHSLGPDENERPMLSANLTAFTDPE